MADKIDAAHKFLLKVAEELSRGDLTFPTFIDATLKVRSALNKPDISADGLARIVLTEPLLSAKVIRLANSAAINPSGVPIGDVRTAVIRIGFNSVRTLAIALAMEQLVQSEMLKGHERLARVHWDHCVDVAAHCYVVAKRYTRINPHEAMFVGVVHNIGAFYLLARLGNRTDIAARDDELVRVLDEWQISISHAVLSALEMPDDVSNAVADQEVPLEGEIPKTLAEILYTSIRLSASHPSPESLKCDETVRKLSGDLAESGAERLSLVTAMTG